jgi:hypothetical protein
LLFSIKKLKMKIGFLLLALALLVSLVAAANMDKYNLRKGKEFLEKKALEEGVVALPSGLQYKVVTEGPAGGKSPSAADTVSVHYRGTLIDGTEVSTAVVSIEQPALIYTSMNFHLYSSIARTRGVSPLSSALVR